MSYSEEDNSDNNTEGPLVDDDEQEVSDQRSSDNNTLSSGDEHSASETEGTSSETPWDLPPEFQEITGVHIAFGCNPLKTVVREGKIL